MPPRLYLLTSFAFFVAFGTLVQPAGAKSGGPVAKTDKSFMGLYMQGQKIGYASSEDSGTIYRGKKAHKSVSYTLMSVGLLSTPMKLVVRSVSITSPTGQPISMTFDEESNGRNQTVLANFEPTSVVLYINSTGTKTKKILSLPKGSITDDPLKGLQFSQIKTGTSKSFYVLDPTTQSFVKNSIVFKGIKKYSLNGEERAGNMVEIIDPRSTSDVYLDKKGDIVKIDGAMGISMIPESREKAIANVGTSNVDLAIGNKITPVGDLVDPATLSDLKLKITSEQTEANIPSDSGQTVTGTPGLWNLDVHPVKFNIPGNITILNAAQNEQVWTKPDTNVPSDSTTFVTLAHQIIGNSTDVSEASRKVQLWVNSQMQPDASIAVLRNANEILKSKRGVCRDYAILTATILRAAGIPAKLVTGLVSWDGDFYYHAWVEFYNGSQWIGLDSTTPDAQLSAAHIKLASGTVAEAYMAPFLQNPKIIILGSQN